MLKINVKRAKIVELLEELLQDDSKILGREVKREEEVEHFLYHCEESNLSDTHNKFDFYFSINDNFYKTLDFNKITIMGEEFSEYFEWYCGEDVGVDIMVNFLEYLKSNL